VGWESWFATWFHWLSRSNRGTRTGNRCGRGDRRVRLSCEELELRLAPAAVSPVQTYQDPMGGPADFGYSVALSGTNVLLGAPGENGSRGAAYLYDTSGQLLHTFTDPNNTADDLFGNSVALSGSNVLVAAYGVNGFKGAVYLYSTSGQLLQTFTDPNNTAFDFFGNSVALSGSNVLVAAYGINGFKGAVYLYSTSGGSPLQTFLDPNNTANDDFGNSVALSNSNVLVGAYGVNGFKGMAYLYSTSGGSPLQTFLDPNNTADDFFGLSVALSGSNVLVGAYGVNGFKGASYLYSTSGGSPLQTFLDPNNTADDSFGTSVALSGSKVLITADAGNGVNDAAYLYSTSGGSPLQTFLDPNTTVHDNFGASAALSGSNVLVGADAVNGFQGGAYLYQTGPVASHFLVIVPEQVAIGKPARVRVVALDAAGHAVPTYTGTIAFTSSDAKAALPSPYTFTADDYGRHTFRVIFHTAGSQTVTATDTTTQSITGSATTTVQGNETSLAILAQGSAWSQVYMPAQQQVLRSAHQVLAATGLTESELSAILHVPAIHWANQMVVLVSTGFGEIAAQTPEPSITALSVHEHTLTVHWELLKPDPHQIFPDFVALTDSFAFVLVHRVAGPVTFQFDGTVILPPPA